MMRIFLLLFVVYLMHGITDSIASDLPYGYPISNPLAATVVGTPTKYQAENIPDIPLKRHKLRLFKDRRTPKYFWYNAELTYGVLAQETKAPLIFIIAGTGGNFNAPTSVKLAQIFYQAGFHVVSLPSSTHMSFIIATSSSSVPGLLDDDSNDLYNVMKTVWDSKLKHILDVTDFNLTGYSLGGAQAAYVSSIDEQQQHFKFRKVLVLNTPVSLINSVNILDSYVDESFPPDKRGQKFDEFWREIWELLAIRYSASRTEELQFSPDFLFELYKNHDLSDERLRALIAVAFRISAASMMMTSDVMTQSGLIVPKDKELKVSENMTEYFSIAHRLGFRVFAEKLVLPYFKSKDASITFDQLIERASLHPIKDYLKSTNKVGLIHNHDDIIMSDGEIDWLLSVFGDRAKIFPIGGHLGNFDYKENVDYMLNFFTQ